MNCYDEKCYSAEMNSRELLAMILNADASLSKRDSAMYYLLNERLRQSLNRRFEPYGCKLEDSFEDVLMDFFLELRGDDGTPYKKLLAVRNASSFEGWLIIYFRNFVAKKAFNSSRQAKSSEKIDFYEFKNLEQPPMDRLINLLSILVAYCCQEFKPVGRIIFLRMILTMLDNGRALPDSEVATALGITDVYYRVQSYRLKCKVQKIKGMLMQGIQLPLTPDSKRLADDLDEDFSGWYQKISVFYEATLESLPQFEAISALRRERESQESGMLHDSAVPTYASHSRNLRKNAIGEINRLLFLVNL